MNTVSLSLGSAIRIARKERGLSQEQLASLLGLNKSQVSRVENGLCRSMSTIDSILSVMKLSPVIELKSIREPLSMVDVLSVLRKYKVDNADKLGILQMGLFGSYARNEQNLESDVDVCVQLSQPSYMTRAAIKEGLEALLGREVDVISLSARMDQDFRSNLLNDVVYV